MNRVLFFVSISILFLKFHILCTACRLSYVEDCRHPCMLSGNPDIIPAIIRAICRSGIPAFTQAIPMACLPVVLHDWMVTGQFPCRPAVRYSCLPYGTPSGVLAFLQSGILSF
ncbi:MAG: hypothetical protein U2P89_08790 [Proteiniphilum sp.]|uniref:hypothetical protein n=1 Tax=Proteiniphilum sp. TaxID=1926877 RepID=UPI0011150A54|nr:hypothetical protein [Proteiniphilum sp.]MDY9918952.1 hypothetical protein [Proteiniphilum sp.]